MTTGVNSNVRRFGLNKLVRDTVVEQMQQAGQQVECRSLDDEAFTAELHRKLLEEAIEFSSATTERAPKELADVLEVVEASAGQLGLNFEQLRELQLARRAEQGGFERRTYVETVCVADEDPWQAYYRSDPEKYPEL